MGFRVRLHMIAVLARTMPIKIRNEEVCSFYTEYVASFKYYYTMIINQKKWQALQGFLLGVNAHLTHLRETHQENLEEYIDQNTLNTVLQDIVQRHNRIAQIVYSCTLASRFDNGQGVVTPMFAIIDGILCKNIYYNINYDYIEIAYLLLQLGANSNGLDPLMSELIYERQKTREIAEVMKELRHNRKCYFGKFMPLGLCENIVSFFGRSNMPTAWIRAHLEETRSDIPANTCLSENSSLNIK